MFSKKKIKLLVSINNYIQGMVSLSMEDKYQKQNTVMFRKKIELAFEIGFPVN